MPVSPDYRPDPRFFDLGEAFADAVAPAEFPAAILRRRDQRAAASVGLATLTAAEWEAHFARFRPLPGQPGPLAMRYHGHQFRQYNPEIGDGRGFLAAQLREVGTGRLMDLGTKGSGQTPWSRHGDGRLTLKGGVREVLAAAMLETLGVPTSRALSLFETGEALQRHDEPSPTRSSVLVRLQHSHVRIGVFQRHAFFGRTDLLERLLAHVREAYFPDAADAAAVLAAAVGAGARLVARWTAAGFVHGVLNTDNQLLTGDSFDYGPWRFLPRYDPGFTAAYFDHTGLYAFARQAESVFWNLRQLAGTLRPLGDEAALLAALNGFGPAYVAETHAAFRARLGLGDAGPEAGQRLVEATLDLLAAGGEALRWEPLFFDWFGGQASADRARAGPRAGLYAGPAFEAFRAALLEHPAEQAERLAHPVFARPEPEEMLIEEVEAIWAAIAERDDWTAFEAKLDRLEAAREAYGLAP